MTESVFELTPLGKRDRSGFDCGSEPLNRYFAVQVGQDIRRRVTACFVASVRQTGEIAGYYTICAAGVPVEDVPKPMAANLPFYPSVPAARLGRLAVARKFQGQRIGNSMLWNATLRAAASEVAMFAMVVDAKDEAAEAFYRHHGFVGYGSLRGMMIARISSLLGRQPHP